MSASTPLVSIGMPIYNEERYLPAALDSLLAQDFADFELIISDNASEDATGKICLEYAARDRRIRYYRNETNLGSVENFNRAFRLSRGRYFMWASGHDLRSPCLISKSVEALEREPAAVLCYPRARLIYEDGGLGATSESYVDTRGLGRVIRFNIVLWNLVSYNAIYGLIRSEALRTCRPARIVYGPDVVLLAELAIRGPFIYLPELLFYAHAKWSNRHGLSREDIMRQMFKMMTGSEAAAPPRLPFVDFSYELVLGALHSPAPLRMKPALVASAVVSSSLSWYRNLPSFLRRPLRAIVRNRLRVSE
jgi:glycosyltransferase involved in cell wall biosynthesis